ncbi:LysR family transcriptional regulator [Vibrio mexicanus]|uniref:LysR family transcriptional regulator n=1 Tax=Vibrio mexicanus TaxID=1004326 RepID=UPI00063C0F70|nr:LysR family transcriptional regulator [Vibrio mexicanus]
MLNQINLSDIRSFVLIAQLGNFTKAADVLNVSRSHVSRQISQLEAQMGVTLLIRTTRTLKLTEAGKGFYLKCEQAMQGIDEALLSAVEDVESIQGNIKINSVGGYLGEEIVARLASDFMLRHSEVTIDLDFSSHRVDLIEEDFDIALRMGKLEDAGFIARKLLDIQMSTLASPSYLKQHGKPQDPKALSEHRCLTGSVNRWNFVNENNKEIEVRVQGQLRCKNGRVLVNAALNGNGIIRVPTLYCQSELEKGELVEVFEEWGIPSVEFSAIYSRDPYQPKRLKAFIDYLKSSFESYRS